MKKTFLILSLTICTIANAQTEHLIYHDIKTDANGNIKPWYNDEPGKAWSHVIQLVWHFWDTMRVDLNGLPYYMNHQVWRPDNDDPRGMGGDQFAMALSSWRLLYGYTGDYRLKQNMTFIVDYYLSHSLSPSNAVWANIPYPYNTLVLSGIFDGDMILGTQFTQPDKAGSFAWELVQFYKMIAPPSYERGTEKHYLNAAITIANTLAKNIKGGNENTSPMPFKVNAITGEVGKLRNNDGSASDAGTSNYTTNWAATLNLFEALQEMNVGNVHEYKKGFDIILKWMKKYPLQNNKWGPFFEDIPGFSNTQINAITFAQYMMNHQKYFPEWKTQVKNIFKWANETLGNKTWEKYGVTVMNEQTVYKVPGNSHTSREASAELQYAALTGDTSYVTNAVRQLNWATYMVDVDGKNRYPNDENWLTDGYGDYVRHFLRAMAAMPQMAPSEEDHLLSSTSVIQNINYKDDIHYNTYDDYGTEVFRLEQKPSSVLFNDKPAKNTQTYDWQALDKGGILTIKRTGSRNVTVVK